MPLKLVEEPQPLLQATSHLSAQDRALALRHLGQIANSMTRNAHVQTMQLIANHPIEGSQTPLTTIRNPHTPLTSICKQRNHDKDLGSCAGTIQLKRSDWITTRGHVVNRAILSACHLQTW
jgi:hypothetical protein